MPRSLLLILLFAGSVLAAEPASDTEKQVGPLLEQAEDLYMEDKARALPLLEQARDWVRRQPAADAEAHLLAFECWITGIEEGPDAFLRLGETGMAYARERKQDRWAAELLLCHGYGLESKAEYEAALGEYAAAVKEGRRLHEPLLLADALSTRADLLSFRGNFADAIIAYQEAYPLFVKIGRERNIRYVLDGIANLYSRLGEHGRALEYLHQLYVAAEATQAPLIIGASLISIGHALSRKGDHAQALERYQQAWDIFKTEEAPGQLAILQQSLGASKLELNQPADALNYLDDAMTRFQKLADPVQLALTRVYRGRALQALKRETEALTELDAAVPVLKERDNLRYLAEAQRARHQLLAASKQWPTAYAELNAFLDTHTELDQQLREEQTARLRVQFDSEKKEQENSLLQKENAQSDQALAAAERIRWLQSIVIALSSVLLVVFGYLAYKQVKATRRMQSLALTDELTTLPNRRHILTYANDQISLARDNKSMLCALVFDVDYFKRINDSHGHLIGDQVLQRIALACNNALREGDKLGRTGGEEFLVVLPGAKAPAAMEVAERLRQAVDQIDCSDLHPTLHVTISIGVCEWAPNLTDINQLSHRADNALYRAKESGRNRIELAVASEA